MSPKEALLLVDPEALSQLLSPGFDPAEWAKIPILAKGLPASPGAASGQVVFTADDAVEWTRQGKQVILVRKETVPDDIHGMHVAQGILTATGGMTSHAAVVGRQMGKPSIVGAGSLTISEKDKQFTVDGKVVKEGEFVSFDGLKGEIKLGKMASKPSEILQVVNGQLDAEEVGHLPALQQDPRVGRQGSPPGHPRERGPAGSGRAGLRVRRARHRPVPHRAHVLRRRSPADRAAHDPRRQRHRPEEGGARAAAAAARATSTACSRR